MSESLVSSARESSLQFMPLRVTSGRLPLHLNQKEWKEILHWFLRGLPAAVVAQETRLNRKLVLRALTHVRMEMQLDVPDVF